MHITSGLEILTFARVYENLELLVNKEFVLFGTMVKYFDNIEESLYKEILFDTKTGTSYWKGAFACFGNKFLPS